MRDDSLVLFTVEATNSDSVDSSDERKTRAGPRPEQTRPGNRGEGAASKQASATNWMHLPAFLLSTQ